VSRQAIGVESIGIAIGSYALDLSELEIRDKVSAGKYTSELGCRTMTLCAPEEDVISLATKAAKRALNNWQGSIDDIGLVVVATETAMDMSRPLSAWIMAELGLRGDLRSYELKHACLAGTIALNQACEWIASGNNKDKAALVICVDVAKYAKGHSGEPTQGAGSIAFLVKQAKIFAIELDSYSWSEPNFDFWRPIGANYPNVNGRLTLSCYNQAVISCFAQLSNPSELLEALQEYRFINFHVPFSKIVQNSFIRLCKNNNISSELAKELYAAKLEPTLFWNQQVGNTYTASLWMAVCCSLTIANADDKLLAFSYGSGCGAELLKLKCCANQKNAKWALDFLEDLRSLKKIKLMEYNTLRG